MTPAAGAVFTSTSQAFSWSSGTRVTAYRLDVGSATGASNYFAGVATTNRAANVTGLPDNGSAVWVRLSSQIDGAWQTADYSFTAWTAPPPPPPAVPAALISPAPGSVFTSTSQTFSWSAGTRVTAYRLSVGSTMGGTNYSAGVTSSPSALSATVIGLPNNGSTVWAASFVADRRRVAIERLLVHGDGGASAATTAACCFGPRQPNGRRSIHGDHTGLCLGRRHGRVGLPARYRIDHRHQ